MGFGLVHNVIPVPLEIGFSHRLNVIPKSLQNGIWPEAECHAQEVPEIGFGLRLNVI